ncbi:hypothetical protein BN000_04174 [Mycobacterium europaeum]|uniref:Uncharacterized protein n=1 Tax=Mycobacterium europaeum TaxID=761804 RepID=A0A0U1DNU2_9MYCO|nr:hypothetical protein BN000_04174 [Mycobacterium europaeum]
MTVRRQKLVSRGASPTPPSVDRSPAGRQRSRSAVDIDQLRRGEAGYPFAPVLSPWGAGGRGTSSHWIASCFFGGQATNVDRVRELAGVLAGITRRPLRARLAGLGPARRHRLCHPLARHVICGAQFYGQSLPGHTLLLTTAIKCDSWLPNPQRERLVVSDCAKACDTRCATACRPAGRVEKLGHHLGRRLGSETRRRRHRGFAQSGCGPVTTGQLGGDLPQPSSAF